MLSQQYTKMRLRNNVSILCPSCQENEAINDRTYGVLPCQSCREEHDKIQSPTHREFTSSSIKQQRGEYSGSMLQPYHGGHLSKEYIDRHGTDKLDVTKQDIRNAKEVYKGKIKRHHKIKESK